MTMSPERCRAIVADDMVRVDDTIRARLSSSVALINQLSNYIIASGGKRLRPQLVLLAANACGYEGDQHINVAAIIEFIHTATLLHDDVVDASDKRRGCDTANAVWGNEAAVLVGDFLYSRAFEMMVGVNSLRVMDILARTTNRIAEGEVLQLLNVNEPDISEAQYLEVIEAKTARLFQAATQLGAVLADKDEGTRKALTEYGNYLGTAFQIADDVIDYQADASVSGKNVGDDLAEGKTTLPLIYAMRDGTDAQKKVVSAAILTGGLEKLDDVLSIVHETNALAHSLQRARQFSEQAATSLNGLPASEYKDALAFIAHYSVDRNA